MDETAISFEKGVQDEYLSDLPSLVSFRHHHLNCGREAARQATAAV
jgi:hypothetical protein